MVGRLNVSSKSGVIEEFMNHRESMDIIEIHIFLRKACPFLEGDLDSALAYRTLAARDTRIICFRLIEYADASSSGFIIFDKRCT